MTTVVYLGLMKLLILLFSLTCFYTTTSAQTQSDTAVVQIRQLLRPGKHLVHYIRENPNKQLTGEQIALLDKVRKALPENTDWVLDPHSAKHITGKKEDILNDVRVKLNLAEEEWKSLQELTNVAKKQVEMYGADTLEIAASGNVLYFRGTGEASGLDSVYFDLSRNIALYRQFHIPFMSIFHISEDANAFHTPLVTYAYELNNNSMTDSSDINTIHIERYDFGVSYQPQTGKVMLIFMTATGNMQDGKPVMKPNLVTFFID